MRGAFFVQLLAKTFATSSSVGSGSAGGVFTPSMFIGAALGGGLASLWLGGAGADRVPVVGAFALVGMASAVAATTHAPLMAAALAFEMSGELAALGPIDGELRAHALKLAIERMRPIAEVADVITERLRARGWPLTTDARLQATASEPIRMNPFTQQLPRDRSPGDARDRGDVDAMVHELETAIGLRLPVMLEAFWRVVGQIDWTPTPDERLPEWLSRSAIETVDPFCVRGITDGFYAVSDWRADIEQAGEVELVEPLHFHVAADSFGKMMISGGRPYQLPADGSFDPPVLYAPESLRLYDYIVNGLRWGGFPGVAYLDETHPLRDIVRELTDGMPVL